MRVQFLPGAQNFEFLNKNKMKSFEKIDQSEMEEENFIEKEEKQELQQDRLLEEEEKEEQSQIKGEEKQLKEIRQNLLKLENQKILNSFYNEAENDRETANEIIISNDKKYFIKYISKDKLGPRFGEVCYGNIARVREDLSPKIRRFVKEHELYHLRDEAKWGGQLGSEIRASIIPGIKDPLGLLATVWATVSSKERIKFYLDRIKRGY